jgi:hypothetical protein
VAGTAGTEDRARRVLRRFGLIGAGKFGAMAMRNT